MSFVKGDSLYYGKLQVSFLPSRLRSAPSEAHPPARKPSHGELFIPFYEISSWEILIYPCQTSKTVPEAIFLLRKCELDGKKFQ